MDSYGKLKLSWSVGYNCSPLHFIDDNTLVYASGSSLTFLRTTGEIVCSTPSHGSGVGPLAVCKEAQTLAYAEVTLRPLIFVIKYPGNSIEGTLKGGAKLEYTGLAFSKNGRQLASLSGVPDFLLTIWDCSGGEVLCETPVGPGGINITMNPLNWKQVSLIGPSRITLWTLEQCGPQNLQSPTEIHLPELSCHVGQSDSHDSTTNDNEYRPGMKVEKTTSEATFPVPDMTAVMYSESYDKFMATKDLVIPESQCWGPQQCLYVGCKGGQILAVDPESGAVTVLANPQVLKDENESGEDQDTTVAPQTGHAVLGVGCTQVMGVSKRGLFAGGQDGQLWCFDLANNLMVLDSLKTSSSIASLCLSPSGNKLALGTSKGEIHVMESSCLSSTFCTAEHGYTPFIGVDVLTPGTGYCVTCRAEGCIQVWDMQQGKGISTLTLPYKCSSLVCPNSSAMVVVGTAKGSICMISLVDPLQPKLVLTRRMHSKAVTALRCDQYGRFMASISQNGPVIVYKASPSTKCTVLGYTDVLGDLLELSVMATGQAAEDETTFAVLSEHGGKTSITVFQIPNKSFEQAVPQLYQDTTNRFSATFTSMREFNFTEPVCGFSLLSTSCVVATISSTKMLAKFTLPTALHTTQKELAPHGMHASHELAGGMAKLSLNQKLLGSVAPDGKLIIRLTDNLDKPLLLNCHHHSRGGCDGLAFSNDSYHVFTTGDSGTLSCWEWELTAHGNVKASQAAEYNTKLNQRLESIQTAENIALASMNPLSVQPDSDEQEDKAKQWLQLVIEETHNAEDQQYSEAKAKLRQELSSLREKVTAMIAANDQLPAIEQLERREFILDTEEHKQLQAEEDAYIQKVREEIELSNLLKMYLRDKIKRECWDSMKVKGRIVKAFQSKLEVRNYSLLQRNEATLKELERIKTHRRIELAEQEIRQLASKPDPVPTIEERGGTGEEEGDSKQDTKEQGDPDALKGSHGSRYGGDCDLLRDQFELYSPVSKKQQMCLLQDCIYRIKETFNKEFDDISKAKEAEIGRIIEKNTRIRKIMKDLKLSEPVVDPTLDPCEQPESFLIVQDNEIKAEKYIPPEEQKRLQEAALAEEKKRLAEIGDNPRERALEMMMYGRLEANAEEELFKDLARPDFMSKDPAEMTEDEIRMAKEFEKKEAAFLEEREKLKKVVLPSLTLSSSLLHPLCHRACALIGIFNAGIGS